MLADGNERAGVQERPRKRRDRLDDGKIAELLGAGRSAKWIAAECGITRQGVRKSAKRSGLTDKLRGNADRSAPASSQPMTQSRLRELLHYDEAAGVFTRRVARPGAKIGTVAGHIHKCSGYTYIWLDGASHLAHRLAWLYVHGTWPNGLVDHKNRNNADNSIDNLREADHSLNAQNAVLPRGDKLLPLGVFKHKNGRFTAAITTNGKPAYLGVFDDPEAASAAYQAAKSNFHEGAVL